MLMSNNQCSIVVAVALVLYHANGSAIMLRCNSRSTTSVARPKKKCRTTHNWAETYSLPTIGEQCYWLNNWFSHWFKVLSFQWTTLMQDTPDIAGAGYEYDFT